MSLMLWIEKSLMAEFNYVMKQHYRDCFCTLKETSYDKENDYYLCQSSMQVIDFDAVTKELYPQKQPSSYDALLPIEVQKEIFYIEFKNQKTSKIKNQEIQKKVIDSYQTLKTLSSKHHIGLKEYRRVLCIVYQQERSLYRYRRFKENVIHFDLQQYEGKYFDDVITNDITFFQIEYKKKVMQYPDIFLDC